MLRGMEWKGSRSYEYKRELNKDEGEWRDRKDR